MKQEDPIKPEVRAAWEQVAEQEGGCVIYGMAWHLHVLDGAIRNVQEHLKQIQNGEDHNHGS
jgi:hypothetical protein